MERSKEMALIGKFLTWIRSFDLKKAGICSMIQQFLGTIFEKCVMSIFAIIGFIADF